MLCISICDKAGLLSEKCKRCVTNLSHLPAVEDCHEDEDDVDDNVYNLTSTTTICNLDSVNYPRPHSSFISMLFNCHTFMHLLFRDKTACFFVHTLYLAFTYICMFLQIVGKQCNGVIKSNG